MDKYGFDNNTPLKSSNNAFLVYTVPFTILDELNDISNVNKTFDVVELYSSYPSYCFIVKYLFEVLIEYTPLVLSVFVFVVPSLPVVVVRGNVRYEYIVEILYELSLYPKNPGIVFYEGVFHSVWTTLENTNNI